MLVLLYVKIYYSEILKIGGFLRTNDGIRFKTIQLLMKFTFLNYSKITNYIYYFNGGFLSRFAECNDKYIYQNAKKNGLMIELIPSNRQSIAELMPEFSKKNNTIQLKIQILKNSNEEIVKLTEIIHTAASTIKEKGTKIYIIIILEAMKKVD